MVRNSMCRAYRSARVAYTWHDGLRGDAGVAAGCERRFVYTWSHAPYDLGALDAALADIVAHSFGLRVWSRGGGLKEKVEGFIGLGR
jgi:hypothetical protein